MLKRCVKSLTGGFGSRFFKTTVIKKCLETTEILKTELVVSGTSTRASDARSVPFTFGSPARLVYREDKLPGCGMTVEPANESNCYIRLHQNKMCCDTHFGL